MARKTLKILNVVGARPNFMKIAPIIAEIKKRGVKQTLVHTGQHYDYRMSRLFFKDLELPRPDINLGVGSGTHAVQTAEIIKRSEAVFKSEKPDIVLVVGDVNSTLAGALTATKMGIPVAHVEAGLRSFDRSMPEEVNRLMTDSIAEYLFVTEESGVRNLRNEGIPSKKIYFVGNTMIDTLLKYKEKALRIKPLNKNLDPYQKYCILTLHRPNNIENKKNLKNILHAIKIISKDIAVVFPAHPRTLNKIIKFGLRKEFLEVKEKINKGIYVVEPLGYLQFLSLMTRAKLVFTDSGGIQEETTVLGIPCITLRENTERPVTVKYGTNVLTGADSERILHEAYKRLNGNLIRHKIPKYWDGKAAERIVKILIKSYL
jgi:UDP-N-acetylglucosamine 2-epimerase (non-hydrolysing)